MNHKSYKEYLTLFHTPKIKNSIAMVATSVCMLAFIGNVEAIPFKADFNPNQETSAKQGSAVNVSEEEKAKQIEAAKNDPNIAGVENFCLLITKARLGKSYTLRVTDRRVPIPNDTAYTKNKYTVVGAAEGDPQLSFVCKITLDENNKYHLEDFQILEVIRKDM